MKLSITVNVVGDSGKTLLTKTMNVEDDLNGIDFILRSTSTANEFIDRMLQQLDQIAPDDDVKVEEDKGKTKKKKEKEATALVEDKDGKALAKTTALSS